MFQLKNSLIFLILLICASTTSAQYAEKSNDILHYEDFVLRRQVAFDVDEIKRLLNDLNRRMTEKQEIETMKTKELPFFDVRYDPWPLQCHTNYTPSNCDTATSCVRRSGIYEIQSEQYNNPSGGGNSFYAECDAKTEDGGWLVIQRRQDGSEDFYRDWSEYKRGFGNLQGEFFIGLDKLFALTNFHGQQELLVVLEDKGESKLARYSSFRVANETEFYTLKSVGKYSGTAGDSLQHHVGMKFTTRDRDNDLFESNCAQTFLGAWWHNKCHVSNLNGKYGDDGFGKGINWHAFKGHNRSIQYVKMMIRRRRE